MGLAEIVANGQLTDKRADSAFFVKMMCLIGCIVRDMRNGEIVS